MRYTIQTVDEQGLIGIQLGKWEKEGKVQIIERSDTLVELQARLDRVVSALSILKKAGYSSEVMVIYLQKKSGLGASAIKNLLYNQEQFLKQIGALK